MLPSTTISSLKAPIEALEAMNKVPDTLYYKGNLELLKRPKIAVVGTRKPNAYTRQITAHLCNSLAKRGICIVSGAAMGVDAIAHKSAGAANTIAVMANGLDIRYPAVNKALIADIEHEGLVLSQFESGERARAWSFVVRNEVVVALGEVLVVAQADRNSGTMRSVAFAKAMGKPIFVLPHRMGESEGSNDLLKEGSAEAIYEIEQFCERFAPAIAHETDEFLNYCTQLPSYEEAFRLYGEQLFAYELEGKIKVEHGRVYPLTL